MQAHLTVISEHFSERVQGPGGHPVDLADTAVPTSADTPAAKRLVEAVAEAVREMRLRLRSTPAGGDAPLRLALVSTTDAGTGMEIETAPPSLQEVDLQSRSGREQVLESVRELERTFLS